MRDESGLATIPTPELDVGADARTWAATADRGLEDYALKLALDRARGRALERRSAAWALEEMRAGMVVGPDGTLERWGIPGVPMSDPEVREALERYGTLNAFLARRLRAAKLGEAEIRRGLAPALTYWRQVEAVRRYHAEMAESR